jgi:hypothetical protein
MHEIEKRGRRARGGASRLVDLQKVGPEVGLAGNDLSHAPFGLEASGLFLRREHALDPLAHRRDGTLDRLHTVGGKIGRRCRIFSSIDPRSRIREVGSLAIQEKTVEERGDLIGAMGQQASRGNGNEAISNE